MLYDKMRTRTFEVVGGVPWHPRALTGEGTRPTGTGVSERDTCACRLIANNLSQSAAGVLPVHQAQ
jgi:hypothetical protein